MPLKKCYVRILNKLKFVFVYQRYYYENDGKGFDDLDQGSYQKTQIMAIT